MSTFPDGVFEYGGAPVGGGRFSSPWATHYFVDGQTGNGSDAFDGTAPDRSKATIQAAVTAASAGDIIYVRPLAYTSDASDVNRYVESVTVPYATADLSLIGVSNTYHGDPNYGAKLQYTETSGQALIVNAPAFHIENMCVRSEGATNGIYLSGNSGYTTLAGSCGATIYSCTLRGGQFAVDTVGGYATNIVKCKFQGGTSQDNSIRMTGSALPFRRFTISECHFDSFNGTAIDNAYIRILGSSSDLLIVNNFFDIKPTDTYYINATGSNLGLIAHNWFAEADLDTDAEIVQGGLTVVDCYDVAGRAAAT